MRRFVFGVAMLAALGAWALGGGFQGSSPASRGGFRGPTASAGASKSIETAIVAGDKTGNWWALKADGTMLASSALTMAAQGAPPVSPITLNGTSQFYQSTTIPTLIPAGDFSIVCVVKFVNLTADQGIVAKWQSGTLDYYLVMDHATGFANFDLFTSTGGFVNAVAGVPFTPGTWQGIAATYTSSTSTGRVRFLGTTTSNAASGTGVASGGINQNVGAASDSSAKATMSTRGCFFTEKVLSDADMDRIGAGAL